MKSRWPGFATALLVAPFLAGLVQAANMEPFVPHRAQADIPQASARFSAPRVPTGQANGSVPGRDVTVATGVDRSDTGQTRITSIQDLQIVSGLAPVVRQGDRVSAYFTVRNGGDRSMQVEVTVHRAGAEGRLPARSLQLARGEARELDWPVLVPGDATELEWHIEANEIGGPARHSLKATQRVLPVLPVRVQSSALYRLDKQMDVEIAPPEGALTGEVRVTFAASLTDGQGAMRDHMRRYPYT